MAKLHALCFICFNLSCIELRLTNKLIHLNLWIRDSKSLEKNHLFIYSILTAYLPTGTVEDDVFLIVTQLKVVCVAATVVGFKVVVVDCVVVVGFVVVVASCVVFVVGCVAVDLVINCMVVWSVVVVVIFVVVSVGIVVDATIRRI